MASTSCSTVSMALEEPLFATASEAAAWLLVEQAGPWGHSALVESRLDPEVGAELQARTKKLGIKALLVKPAGRNAGGRRCFLGRSDQRAPFLDEHHIEDDPDLLALDLEALARGERPAGGRPVDGPLYLVCTNSRRDACCARLGRPVAAALDEARPGRVWECSHLGGHRFAANLVCLPDGLWFGRLSQEDALAAAADYESGRIHLSHLRGNSSLAPAAQAADYYVRRQAGPARDRRPDSREPRSPRSRGCGDASQRRHALPRARSQHGRRPAAGRLVPRGQAGAPGRLVACRPRGRAGRRIRAPRQMIDRELIGNRGTAGWRPIPSPESTLVARPYLRYERANDRGLRLGLCRPRRHHTSRSTI